MSTNGPNDLGGKAEDTSNNAPQQGAPNIPPPPGAAGGPPPPPPAFGGVLPEEFEDKKAELLRMEAEIDGDESLDALAKYRKKVKLRTDFQAEFFVANPQIRQDAIGFLKSLDNRRLLTTKLQELQAEFANGEGISMQMLQKLNAAATDEETRLTAQVERLAGKDDGSGDQLKHTPGDIETVAGRFDAMIATREQMAADNMEMILSGDIDPDERNEIEQENEQLRAEINEIRARREHDVGQLQAELDQYQAQLAEASRVKKASFNAQGNYKKVYGGLKINAPKGKKADDQPSGQAVDIESNAQLWRAVFKGYRLRNAINYVALDQEERDSLDQDDVIAIMHQLANPKVGSNALTVGDMIAIATGYLVIEPGEINRINPLEGSHYNPNKEKAFERLHAEIKKQNPDIVPPSESASASPVEALKQRVEAAEHAGLGQRAVDRGAPRQAVQQTGAVIGDLRSQLRGRKKAPGAQAEAEDQPLSRKERQKRNLADIDQKREAVEGEAAEHMAQAGWKGKLHKSVAATVDQALHDEPKDELERELFVAITKTLSTSERVPEGERSLSLARTQTLLAESREKVRQLEQEKAQLEQQVDKLETPENLLAGGDLKGALIRMKQDKGRDPTMAEARGIIMSVFKGQVAKRSGYLAQLPDLLKEVAQTNVSAPPKRRGPNL